MMNKKQITKLNIKAIEKQIWTMESYLTMGMEGNKPLTQTQRRNAKLKMDGLHIAISVLEAEMR